VDEREISITELGAFSVNGGYEKLWQSYREGTSKTADFNFWGAFFGIKWFFYRKMYAFGIAALALDAAVPILTAMLLRQVYPMPTLQPDRVGIYIILCSFLLWRCVLGWYANILYYRKAVKAITSLSSANVPNDSYLSAISSLGGTSIPSVLGLFIAVGIIKVVAL
jgi:hypothetical protein